VCLPHPAPVLCFSYTLSYTPLTTLSAMLACTANAHEPKPKLVKYDMPKKGDMSMSAMEMVASWPNKPKMAAETFIKKYGEPSGVLTLTNETALAASRESGNLGPGDTVISPC